MLRLELQRRFHELGDSRSEPFKIADVPGQQSICSRFQSAMSNKCVIGGCTDDGPIGSQLKSGKLGRARRRVPERRGSDG